jgi:hypothetical protein
VQASPKFRRDLFARPPVAHLQPPSRRLSDEKLAAFDRACEQNDLEAAALLLIEYERIVTRVPITLGMGRRREMENLISAHGRLWELLKPHAAE